ncbi:hypothetical protein [Stutzerimonas stutzeri]|uniref:hypothetical protein n=1 Tax=Stutzerimonas stutzeri TaxID=316 RepID=UPI001C2E23C3|nr:hypothetical protein [Stutzerimonas stutzeri]
MKTASLTLALMAALTATGVTANQDAASERQDAHQSQQDRNGEASAHGYQNPAGPDPDPRMTDQVGEDALDQDDEHPAPAERDEQREAKQR